jgi:hypothetical protein
MCKKRWSFMKGLFIIMGNGGKSYAEDQNDSDLPAFGMLSVLLQRKGIVGRQGI